MLAYFFKVFYPSYESKLLVIENFIALLMGIYKMVNIFNYKYFREFGKCTGIKGKLKFTNTINILLYFCMCIFYAYFNAKFGL